TISSPRQGSGVPADRAEAKSRRLCSGKSRSASSDLIISPTRPVAPTMPTRGEFEGSGLISCVSLVAEARSQRFWEAAPRIGGALRVLGAQTTRAPVDAPRMRVVFRVIALIVPMDIG